MSQKRRPDWRKYFIPNSWEAANSETDLTQDEPFIRLVRASQPNILRQRQRPGQK